MTEQTHGYLTVEAIMRIYLVKRSYVYRLASVHGWGRYRHPDGGVRYRYEHVDHTLARTAALRCDRLEGKFQS